MFSAVDGIDFMAQTGIEALAAEADRLLSMIRDKYEAYSVKETRLWR